MKYVSDIRIPVFVLILVLAGFTVSVIEYLHSQHLVSQVKHIQVEVQKDLAVIRSRLEAEIYSDIFYANSLATIASVDPKSTEEQWKHIAQGLMQRSRNLRNVAMAPDDVIQYVYPLEGNEQALGLDFRTVPAQWKTVEISRQSQSIFLSGPVNLVQGGLGLIARVPIFTDPPLNNEYWGNCSAVLDVYSLFENAGIYLFEDKYELAIRGVDGEGDQGAVFYGDPETFDDVFASAIVSLPSGTWYMAISSRGLRDESLPWLEKYSVRIVGYPALAILLALFTSLYLLYRAAHKNSLQDELTHLPNRRFFMYSLNQLIDNSNKKESCFTLLNLDLNHFKSINDTYGHAAGDTVLKAVAKRVRKVIRASDLVARVGGDEYLILLPRLTDKDDVQRVVDSIRKGIKSKPIRLGYADVYPEASIGYTIYNGEDISVDALLHAADTRMYADKVRQKGMYDDDRD